MVTFDKDYSLCTVRGRFVAEVKKLSSSPAISEEEAIQIAMKEYIAQKHEAEAKSIEANLFYPKNKDGSYYLAWKISIRHWGYFIDAMTGNIIKTFSYRKY
jgi:Zn-dependent metalloprotease